MRTPAVDASELVRRLRQCLAGDAGVTFAYLFGSTARGAARPTSDVDLAVMLGHDDRDALARVTASLAAAVHPRRADVVALNHAPPALAYRVLRDGILLVDRDERARVEHRVRVVDRYLDMAPARRMLDEGLRQRLAEGTFGRR